MTRPSLPVGYGTSVRAYQVWDTDTNQFAIQNMLALEDLITAEGNFTPTPTGPSGRAGNKLISYLDGTYEVILTITTINIEPDNVAVPIVNLESLIEPLADNQQQYQYALAPGTGLAFPIEVTNAVENKVISLIPRAPTPVPLPALSVISVTLALIPLKFLENFQVL